MNLKRINRFETKYGIINRFQLYINDRFNPKIKSVLSKDGKELKFTYTSLSGYITIIGEDIEEIIVIL